jgi:hypothetical protein
MASSSAPVLAKASSAPSMSLSAMNSFQREAMMAKRLPLALQVP